VFNFFQAVAETIVASPRIPDESIDASLLRLVGRILGFFAGGWVFVAGARRLGIDVVPLLAGLGVGGLAVALAAQRTFANVIGGAVLFATRPVRVGDFCRYGDQIGTVEDIGLLSTRIRSLERTIVTVPNAEFSEMKLDNFQVRDRRLLKTVLQLRYETTADQLRFVLAKLRELLLGHPKVTPDPARARFLGYGSYSKDIEIFAYLRCQDQDTFLAIQEDIMLRIEDIVREAGADFAFPSQTAYLARDRGLDSERAQRAAGQVTHWRGRGKLPFPEFEEEERERLEDILDYPPKGSPHFTPHDRTPDAPRGETPG
jgi:MscS family membrane protein